MIFAEPCTLREPAFAILEKHGIGYEIAAECADLAGLYAAVRSGLGLALLPAIGKLPTVCTQPKDYLRPTAPRYWFAGAPASIRIC